MFCPQCEGEYREGIATCPTCETALVADLSDLPAAPPAEMPARLASAMVDLVGFVDENEARDARTRLRSAKVACELVIRDAFGPSGAASGDEYWIRVPATSAAAAAVALGTAALTSAEIIAASPDLREDVCPSCGAPLAPDEDCARCLQE